MTYGFDTSLVKIDIKNIIYTKIIATPTLDSRKYKQILSSVNEVGVVEPPVVTPDKSGKYILLDGHLRIEALKYLEKTEVWCLISKSNEGYTYNKFVSRIGPIQENRMIIKAIEKGVSKEKLAKALNIDRKTLEMKLNLLEGICSKVADMLKCESNISSKVFLILKKMKPPRQIEVASLMKENRNYTTGFAEALYAATPKNLLVEAIKKVKGYTDEAIANLEIEEENLKKEFSSIEQTHQATIFNLTLAKSYMDGLLRNQKVIKFLNLNHPEVLDIFNKIGMEKSLGEI